MKSKTKGDVTELMVIASLIKLGCTVSIPYGEGSKYDLIADFKGKLIKIQCKTSRISKCENAIVFNTCAVHKNMNSCVREVYGQSDIDLFATYWDGVCYLIPLAKTQKATFSLRLAPCKQGQTKNVNLANEYKAEAVLNMLT